MALIAEARQSSHEFVDRRGRQGGPGNATVEKAGTVNFAFSIVAMGGEGGYDQSRHGGQMSLQSKLVRAMPAGIVLLMPLTVGALSSLLSHVHVGGSRCRASRRPVH
jgi:hypothetical protein